MFDFLPFDKEITITFISALLAFGTILAITLPILFKSQKSQRVKDIVDKRKRDLFQQAKEQAKKKSNLQENTAAQNMAAWYRVQKIAGDASQDVRELLLRAGIRNPTAPLKYLIARIILPVLFAGLAMLFISGSEKELKDSIEFLIIITAALAGFFLPRILIKNMADKRQQEISLSFPDALDMMLICVQGGIGIEGAISKIANEIADHSEVLAEEMGLLSAELGMLNDRRAAFQNFATRVGGGNAKSFATAMLQAEQYGTSVSNALRVLADEQRDMRMAAAEQKAAALPPKLTVPMIIFFLPALFIVILGPAFLSAP